MIITPVETGHKIQLPVEWAMEFGFKKNVALEKTVAGILVRPCETVSWDDIFAKKLPMGQNVFALDLSEVSGDDILF